MALNSPIHYTWFKINSRIRKYLNRYKNSLFGRGISDERLIRSLDNRFESLETFLEHLGNRKNPKFFIPSPSNDLKQELRIQLPRIEPLTIKAADNIIDHNFDLLGSGPINLGEKIDWHSDFTTGYKWNSSLYYFDIKWATYTGGFDIKIPWELSRFQHVIWLGQAYWFTGDEKYTDEFISQILDWVENNPYPYGVNWSSTMEVSIRVVNWLWGYYYFRNSRMFTEEILTVFVKSLLQHGKHILGNLEIYYTSRGPLKTNHYLSNLLGLVYLGILFPEFREAQRWLEVGIHGLEQEIFRQVMEDGVDFESSTNYHRLVTEIFMSAYLLSRLNGIKFSDPFMSQLEKMVEYIMYITKPNGSVPLIGDNDNGRIHRLKVWKNKDHEWVDFRYLLAIGGILFGRNDFIIAAVDQWEEAFWFFGENTFNYMNPIIENYVQNLTLESRSFTKGGVYVLRHGDYYILIDAGTNGQMGYGGHAHNDIFSFEYYSGGRTWIVDPGAYTYTFDYDLRQRFRSTAYHNTIVVSEQEQNVINTDDPFRMESDAVVNVIDWIDDDEYILFCGEHYGYNRLPENIVHRRLFYFDKNLEVLIIHDLLYGSPSISNMKAASYLHLSQDLIPEPGDGINGGFQISGNNQYHLDIRILEPGDCKTRIEKSWVSPSYGVKKDAKTIAWTWKKQCRSSIALFNTANYQYLNSRVEQSSIKFTKIISNANFRVFSSKY